MKAPLQDILDWWENLADFPKQHIAANIRNRLMPGTPRNNDCDLFRNFLMEEVAANWHIGRTLAIRAVIDFFFWRYDPEGNLRHLLDAVEEENVRLKSLANDALGRTPQAQREMENARDTWRRLREAAISDARLLAVEGASMIRQPPP